MVPITYIFALLAVLVSLSGCSQYAPPGSIQKTNNSTKPTQNNSTSPAPATNGSGSSTDTNTVAPTGNTSSTGGAVPTTIPEKMDTTAVVASTSHIAPFKTETGALSSGMVLDSTNADEFILYVQGEVAEKLDAVLEVEKIPSVLADGKKFMTKIGKSYVCISADVTYCVMYLQSSDGEIIQKVDNTNIKSAAPDLVITSTYKDPGEYFILQPAQQTQKSFVKEGSLSIGYTYAQKIYDAMSMTATAQPDSADGKYKEVSKKTGKNMTCWKELSVTSKQVEYDCESKFEYDTGTFDASIDGDLK